ncbi:hypothetical protein O181_033875 [Austropuccinia psidii MF-1]|uniref:Threonylcarbamoyl-AMP synthase n=1 Tax=Austropuccinia psidii MF-1 TaxID=1389203 RepID=A0A9Q3D213_9BASI|nr:hypothetical protein [Austropuccinia psidii MF-1]
MSSNPLQHVLGRSDSDDHQVKETLVARCKHDSIIFSQGKTCLDIPLVQCPRTLDAIQMASDLMKSDSIVAFPTETVYGLGASALSSTAVAKIFAVKGRPSDNPLIIHISSMDLLKTFLPLDWVMPPTYQALIESFWPGPLTLLMPTTSSSQPVSNISQLVTCGLSTVGVRMPVHPIARALIAQCGVPLAAPSANRSGFPSPTTAQHVASDLDKKISLILDGGPCSVGVESTVVDGLNPDGRLRILRLGGLSVEDINMCLVRAGLSHSESQSGIAWVHNKDFKDSSLEITPTTPGMKYKHYAPRPKVTVLDPVEVKDSSFAEDSTIPDVPRLLIETSRIVGPLKTLTIGLMMIEKSPLIQAFTACAKLPEFSNIRFCHFDLGTIDKPEASAQRLFSALRYLDEDAKVDLIFVERHSEKGLGATVMERLRKASSQTPFQPVRLP